MKRTMLIVGVVVMLIIGSVQASFSLTVWPAEFGRRPGIGFDDRDLRPTEYDIRVELSQYRFDASSLYPYFYSYTVYNDPMGRYNSPALDHWSLLFPSAVDGIDLSSPSSIIDPFTFSHEAPQYVEPEGCPALPMTSSGDYVGIRWQAHCNLLADGRWISSFSFYSKYSKGDVAWVSMAQNSQGWDWGHVEGPVGGGGTHPIPEPATVILLGTGLLGIAGYGRMKIKSRC